LTQQCRDDSMLYMIHCMCGNEIHSERYNLGYKVCLTCGDKIAAKNRKFGYICYGHKTAGSIVIDSRKAVDNYKRVSYRKNKGSNMAYASRLSTTF